MDEFKNNEQDVKEDIENREEKNVEKKSLSKKIMSEVFSVLGLVIAFAIFDGLFLYFTGRTLSTIIADFLSNIF